MADIYRLSNRIAYSGEPAGGADCGSVMPGAEKESMQRAL
jgi:hypothetical protein